MKKLIIRYSTLAVLILAVIWWARDPDWHPAVLFIASLAGYLKTEEKTQLTPNIAGRWEYHVVTSEENFSHKGDCTIRQDGRNIQIHGTRRYTSALKSRKKIATKVNIPWSSEWGEICNDNMMRFHYHIGLGTVQRGGTSIQAICRVSLPTPSLVQMTGNYYVLPPFDQAVSNYMWGSISFRPLGEAEHLEAPQNHELLDDDEEEELP